MPSCSGLPPRKFIATESFSAAPGNFVDMNALAHWLETNGFLRTSTVRDTGEYAVRGGILDLYPPGMPLAGAARLLRRHAGIDPHLRSRDAAHHRPAARARSRADERGAADDRDDPALPAGLCRRLRRADARRHALRGGQRRPAAPRAGALAAAVLRRRSTRCSTISATRRWCSTRSPTTRRASASAQIEDYYDARKARRRTPIRARRPTSRCRPTRSISSPTNGASASARSPVARLTPFASGRADGSIVVDCGARAGPHLRRRARTTKRTNVFDAAVAHIRDLQGQGKRVIVAAWSDGSRERLSHVLAEHGLKGAKPVARSPWRWRFRATR